MKISYNSKLNLKATKTSSDNEIGSFNENAAKCFLKVSDSSYRGSTKDSFNALQELGGSQRSQFFFDDCDDSIPDENTEINSSQLIFNITQPCLNKKGLGRDNFFNQLNWVQYTSDDIFNRYILEEKLGKGGCGEVYCCTHKATNQLRAIKLISNSEVSFAKLTQKLSFEGQIMASLDHPNIVKLYEINREADKCRLVMEFFKGRTLVNVYKEKSYPTVNMIASIAHQLLSALSYLHSNHIVHRDIKCENILVDLDNKDPMVKLIDFGIATHLIPGDKLNNISGSIYYLAPEVFLCSYDEKCDIWSLGIVLYILCFKKLPFHGQDMYQIRDQIVKKEIDWSKFSKCDPALISFLKKLLAKDASQRYTAEQALKDDFFQIHLQESKVETELLSAFQPFNKQNTLKSIFDLFNLYQFIEPAKKKSAIKLFNTLDTRGSGYILMKDLKNLCDKLSIQNSSFVKGFDGKRELSFMEFLLSCSGAFNNSKFSEYLFLMLQNQSKVVSVSAIEDLFKQQIKGINYSLLLKPFQKRDDSELLSENEFKTIIESF